MKYLPCFCALYHRSHRAAIPARAGCVLVLTMMFVACGRTPEAKPSLRLNLPPGAYQTLSEQAKVIIDPKGEATLVRAGKQVPHRLEKRGEKVIVVDAQDGEAFEVVGPGAVPPPRVTAVRSPADHEFEQRRQQWEKERAEKMKASEGARQRALAQLKEARAKADLKR